jgi:hypothetical protein
MAVQQQATGSEHALLERIGAIESDQELHRLVSDYCHGCDRKDEARFMAIWWPDAEWLIGDPWGDFRGEQEIRETINRIWEGLPETHHLTTNLVTNIDGDRATGQSDVWCTATDAADRPLLIAATYDDDFERRDGEWRIASRRVKIHFFTPVLEPWSSDPGNRIKAVVG